MEIINEIKENYTFNKNDYESYEGYLIKTNKQDIFVMIDNSQCCCENWGYFSTNDDLNEFIGAELKNISLTDKALNTIIVAEQLGEYSFSPPDEYDLDDGGIIFVNLETNKGILQLAVYNEHDGYYGHGVFIDSMQLKNDSVL